MIIALLLAATVFADPHRARDFEAERHAVAVADHCLCSHRPRWPSIIPDYYLVPWTERKKWKILSDTVDSLRALHPVVTVSEPDTIFDYADSAASYFERTPDVWHNFRPTMKAPALSQIDMTAPPLTLSGTLPTLGSVRCADDTTAHSWQRVIVFRQPRRSPWVPAVPLWPIQVAYPVDSTAFMAPGTRFTIPEPVLPQGDCYLVAVANLTGRGCLSNPVAGWILP